MRISPRWRLPLAAVAVCAVLLGLAAPARADAPVIHVVQPGENLYRISLRYGTSMAELAAANGIVNINCLYAGQRLVIPRPPWPGSPPPPGSWPNCYRVQHGDTLYRIAARFGTTVWHLAAINGLADPNRIWAGQMLTITGAPCGQWYAAPTPVPCTPPCAPPAVVAPPCSLCPPAHLCGSSCWYGEFFVNHDLTGMPIFQRWDKELKFNWGSGSPDGRVPSDNFSARWTRSEMLAQGSYRVTVRADDGVRVYINSVLVVDAWSAPAATTHTQDVVLKSSSVRKIVVEYFEAQGAAEISFAMERLP